MSKVHPHKPDPALHQNQGHHGASSAAHVSEEEARAFKAILKEDTGPGNVRKRAGKPAVAPNPSEAAGVADVADGEGIPAERAAAESADASGYRVREEEEDLEAEVEEKERTEYPAGWPQGPEPNPLGLGMASVPGRASQAQEFVGSDTRNIGDAENPWEKGDAAKLRREREEEDQEEVLLMAGLPGRGPDRIPDFPSGDAALSSQVQPSTPLSQEVLDLVNRLLVSEPGAFSQEVRLDLRDSVLPGTEIRLLQEGGTLTVSLVTDSDESEALLLREAPELAEALREGSGGDVVVRVVRAGGEGEGRPA